MPASQPLVLRARARQRRRQRNLRDMNQADARTKNGRMGQRKCPLEGQAARESQTPGCGLPSDPKETLMAKQDPYCLFGHRNSDVRTSL